MLSNTIVSKGLGCLKTAVKTLPSSPGVYRLLDVEGHPLYIGKAKKLAERVKSYTHVAGLPQRLKRMVAQVRDIHITETRNEGEALLLEARLIQAHRPPYNIVFKDNKSLPYLSISQEKWPRLRKTRQRPQEKDFFLGPFPAAQEVKETQTLLQKIFKLRTCSDAVFANRKRPCLQYYIKRCSAPCVGHINETDYATDVRNLKKVLQGKVAWVQKKLTEEMQAYSTQQAYEKALSIRKRLEALASIQQKQALAIGKNRPTDVLGSATWHGFLCCYLMLIRHGQLLGGRALIANLHDTSQQVGDLIEVLIAQFYTKNDRPEELLSDNLHIIKGQLSQAFQSSHQLLKVREPEKTAEKELLARAHHNALTALKTHVAVNEEATSHLKALQDWLHLKTVPNHIEVYDNTHLRGTHPYGAMIAAVAGQFDKAHYRLFRIPENIGTQDDYAMMRYVMQKRFQGHALSSPATKVSLKPVPDLIIIDGGKGQLSAVQETLRTLWLKDVPLLAIAKGAKRGRVQERFFIPGTLQDNQKAAWEECFLEKNSSLYFFLERLRDEAHRFGIQRHKKARAQAMTRSSLKNITHVGPKRQKALLAFFGSLNAVKEAPPEQLSLVPGISKALAKTIYDFLQKNDNE